MTSREFQESEGWLQIGKFSSFSMDNDNHREFLEAINEFRLAEKQGLPPEGFRMPDLIGEALESTETVYGVLKVVTKYPRVVGNIVGLDFVPDNISNILHGKYSDGVILYRPVPQAPEA
jgi:hypothetical protein